jgi:hypothetical protein
MEEVAVGHREGIKMILCIGMWIAAVIALAAF